MITSREFNLIANVYGLAQAELCAAGECTHTHYVPVRMPAALAADGEQMVDLRCPESMGKLLGRTQAVALPGGVVELACNNCARRYRAAGAQVARVLHRFNLLGELLSTELFPA